MSILPLAIKCLCHLGPVTWNPIIPIAFRDPSSMVAFLTIISDT